MLKNIRSRYLQAPCLLLSGFLLIALSLRAAEPDSAYMEILAGQYHGEHAVFTNIEEHLVIRFEDGDLTATSYVSEDKLLLSAYALENENYNYAPHSFYNHLADINGLAYVPSKKGYKISKNVDYGVVRSERVFYDDNLLAVQKFPDVTKGTLIHTGYTIEHTDMHILPPFYFQETLPIKKITYRVTAPDFVKMDFLIKGENKDWVKETEETKNGNVIYTFTAENVPAAKKFAGVPSEEYYVPHIIPIIVSYKLPDDQKTKEISSGIDKLYEFDYKYVKNLNIKDDTTIENIVKDVTKYKSNDMEKAAAIYKWVQENIHYVAFEAGLEGFTPREAATVCTRKYGDCKDMTSILIAMFRKAGLEATYTWIGTDLIPYTYEEAPLPLDDNHMICAVKINGEWIFADGTHPELPFGAYRDDIQDKEALVAIDAKNYKVITIPEVPEQKNVTTDSTFVKFYGSELYGNLKINHKGYDAWDLAAVMTYYKNEDREKAIKKLTMRGSDKYIMKKYDYTAQTSGNKDVDITAGFNIRDYVESYKKQHFIHMNLTHDFESSRIDTAKRKVPYYLLFKEKIKDVVVLEIPDSMKVTYIPKPASGNLDGVMSYNITYKADKKKVTLVKEYELKTKCIKPEQFAAYNALLDALEKQYKESVVITAKK